MSYVYQSLYPAPNGAHDEAPVSGGKSCVLLVIHKSIDEGLMKCESFKTGRGPRPSGLDADGMSASDSYGSMNTNSWKAIVKVIKEICIKRNEINAETNETSLDELLAHRLITLDKNLGLRPAGVGD